MEGLEFSGSTSNMVVYDVISVYVLIAEVLVAVQDLGEL